MTGISASWVTRNYYLMFKGQLQGIASIPLNEESGHCPSLQLQLGYLDEEKKLQTLSYQQFKYLLRKFKKELADRGYTEFILVFAGFHIGKGQELTQNLFTVYSELKRLFSNSKMFDWRATDKELHLKTELYSTRRY